MTDAVAPTPSLRDHPLRGLLAGEVHARPYEVLEPPVRVSHLALLGGSDGSGAEAGRAALADLCDRHGIAPPPPGAIHFATVLDQGAGGLRLRWERHSEFTTWTFYRFDPFTDPFAATALDRVPADWLAALPGALLVGAHAALVPGDAAPDLGRVFGDHLVVGSRIGGGAGAAWSDFRLHGDGFARLLIHAGGLTRGQNGRMLQRLLELETYRMMALLGLPVARDLAPALGALERQVAGVMAEMAERGDNGAAAGSEDERALLARLTGTAAEVERLIAAHGYRFAATKAYHAIVERCVRELREERIAGSQTFAEFMDRRFAPAMRTCAATAERAEGLSRRVARASDLLRTRVDVGLEESNRDLLRSMNRRADLQIRLQQTVEGLSVVAISYYLWSLVAYLLKGLKAAGLGLDPDLAALVAVPLVVALVWGGVRHLKAAVGKGQGGEA